MFLSNSKKSVDYDEKKSGLQRRTILFPVGGEMIKKRQKVVSEQYNGCSESGNNTTNIHINVLEHGDGDDSGDSEFTPDQTQKKKKRALQKRRRITV